MFSIYEYALCFAVFSIYEYTKCFAVFSAPEYAKCFVVFSIYKYKFWLLCLVYLNMLNVLVCSIYDQTTYFAVMYI